MQLTAAGGGAGGGKGARGGERGGGRPSAESSVGFRDAPWGGTKGTTCKSVALGDSCSNLTCLVSSETEFAPQHLLYLETADGLLYCSSGPSLPLGHPGRYQCGCHTLERWGSCLRMINDQEKAGGVSQGLRPYSSTGRGTASKPSEESEVW